MYRKISAREKEWLDSLFNIDFKGRDILQKQVLNAKRSYNQGHDYISLKFNIQDKIERYPYKVRVPVEMRAFQQKSLPIIFLLHIINGVIDELEIITADSSQINLDNIELEKVEYEVNKNVLL